MNATMFGVSEKEEPKAMQMQKELEAKVNVDPLQLTGMEKMMGVKAKDIMKLMEESDIKS